MAYMKVPREEGGGDASAKEREVQQAAAALEMYKQELERKLREYESLRETLNSFKNTLKAVEALEGAKTNTQLLMALGPGVYVPVKLSEKNKLVISIGSGVYAKESISQAASKLKKSISLMEKREKELVGDIESLEKKGAEMSSRLQSMLRG